MIVAPLAALAASVVVGRVALHHNHPVALSMATFILACGLLTEVSR